MSETTKIETNVKTVTETVDGDGRPAKVRVLLDVVANVYEGKHYVRSRSLVSATGSLATVERAVDSLDAAKEKCRKLLDDPQLDRCVGVSESLVRSAIDQAEVEQ